jgi:hypothetical protein
MEQTTQSPSAGAKPRCDIVQMFVFQSVYCRTHKLMIEGGVGGNCPKEGQ